MGNILTEIAYKIGIGRKKSKVLFFGANRRLRIFHKEIDGKTKKLIFSSDPEKAIFENRKITTQPFLDDSTNQPVYVVFEGVPNTFDIDGFMNRNATSEQDDLMRAMDIELGKALAQNMDASSLDKKQILLFVIVAMNALILAAIYLVITAIDKIA